MKTLADKLVANPARGCSRAKEAAVLLRKPSANHSANGDPMVERFIFDKSEAEILWEEFCSGEQGLLLDNFRAPMPEMWVEIAHIGYFLTGGRLSMFDGNGTDVKNIGSFNVCGISEPERLLDFCNDFDRTVFWKNRRHYEATTSLFAVLCAFIVSPRAATRKRIERSGFARAGRMKGMNRRSRAVPTYFPLYSFNRMTLRRPVAGQPVLEGIYCDAPTSKRGHYVIGHWRLIDGCVEPYWTWVDSHKRGSEALGFVAHERHVRVAPGSFGLRRGFEIPTFPGAPGTRIPARRPDRARDHGQGLTE